MEHLTLDAKNIRDSLNFMAKYILNKQVDPARSNDLDDFKGIGEAVWNLVSSVYQSKWDSLIADKNNKSLREKIAAKLTPRIIPTPTHNNKALDTSTPASIEKMLPSILAKSQKEVNRISKYFRNTKPVNTTPNKSYTLALKQSYTQASKQANNTLEVIKIKETFPTLNTQKVDQIHKIVNNTPKSKLRIQMTTKGPSRKQIIILMSNDNILKFMKESSFHVANIN